MGPLPASSKGHRYNLVVMDLFTKWVEAFPLQFTESTVLATVLVDEIVWSAHGHSQWPRCKLGKFHNPPPLPIAWHGTHKDHGVSPQG